VRLFEHRDGGLKTREAYCGLYSCQRGFTLMELLIAVAILAVIVTAIYATLFNVISTREDVQAKMDSMREFRRFSAIFSKETRASFFSESNNATLWRGSGGASSSESTAAISMTFFTYPSGKAASGDLMAVNYSAEETEDGTTLYREAWNPYTGEKGIKAEVMENILGFTAEFYDGSKWLDEWDGLSRKSVPEAVRVFIKIKAIEGVNTLTATVVTMVR
jgi:general secretion pathway protein J